jgi:hypothetical protein
MTMSVGPQKSTTHATRLDTLGVPQLPSNGSMSPDVPSRLAR